MSFVCLFLTIISIDLTHSISVQWSLANETMPRAFSSMAYGYNSSLIWLLGGLEENDLWSRNQFTFNPSTQKWELLFPDLSPEFFECSAQCSAQFPRLQNETDFRVFIMGPIQQKEHGDNGWIYYPFDEQFDYTTFNYFPDQAEWPCTVADNTHFGSSIIYIIGGIGEQDSVTWPIADILGYNLTTGSNNGWIQKNLTKMSAARYAGSCILVQDSIYYFGGTDGQNVLSSIERYDILEDKWTTLNTTLNIKRTGHRNVYAEYNNAILIIGGVTDMFDNLASVEWFDVTSQQIIKSLESNMNYKRDEVGAITWNDGNIYVFGGMLNGTYVHNTYEIGVIS